MPYFERGNDRLQQQLDANRAHADQRYQQLTAAERQATQELHKVSPDLTIPIHVMMALMRPDNVQYFTQDEQSIVQQLPVPARCAIAIARCANPEAAQFYAVPRTPDQQRQQIAQAYGAHLLEETGRVVDSYATLVGTKAPQRLAQNRAQIDRQITQTQQQKDSPAKKTLLERLFQQRAGLSNQVAHEVQVGADEIAAKLGVKEQDFQLGKSIQVADAHGEPLARITEVIAPQPPGGIDVSGFDLTFNDRQIDHPTLGRITSRALDPLLIEPMPALLKSGAMKAEMYKAVSQQSARAAKFALKAESFQHIWATARLQDTLGSRFFQGKTAEELLVAIVQEAKDRRIQNEPIRAAEMAAGLVMFQNAWAMTMDAVITHDIHRQKSGGVPIKTYMAMTAAYDFTNNMGWSEGDQIVPGRSVWGRPMTESHRDKALDLAKRHKK